MSRALGARLVLGRALAEEAGRDALAHAARADLGIRRKGPGDLVTAADLAIEGRIRDRVAGAFPEDAVLGEEFGGAARADGFAWLVDPIDGTVNFARRLGYFCVSVALLHAGQPIAAWIFDPLRDEMFHAGPDGGAFLGDLPIACPAARGPADALVGLGFSDRHDPALTASVVAGVAGLGADFRRLGAGALCLAHVAAGRLDAYVEPHMNPWDAVGGLYIAAAAGAVTLDYLGAGGLARGGPVFAAGPALAPALLAALPPPFTGRASAPDRAGDAARPPRPGVATLSPEWETNR